MGYELKLILCLDRGSLLDDVERYRGKKIKARYYSPVAMVDLSKPGHESKVYALAQVAMEEALRHPRRPRAYCQYTSDDEPVFEDCYGQPIAALELRDVIEALEADQADYERDNGSSYRRFTLALAMLKSAAADTNWSCMKVLTYGH